MNGFAKGRVDAESLSDHRRRFDAEGQLAEARVEIFQTEAKVSPVGVRSCNDTWGSDKEGDVMARPLRLEFPGAVYHLTSRGNARTNRSGG